MGKMCQKPYNLVMIREAFQSKKQPNLGISRGGSSKNQKSHKFQLGKVQKEGGTSHFKKFQSFRKFQSLKNNALFSISKGPLNRRIDTFLP